MNPNLKSARAVAVLGTGSDVGKSVIVAALCRLFHRAGARVAPFKAQNMSLNSYVTVAGGEIGRAQALQAQASGIPAHVDMNPILLKPESDHCAQIVVHGSVFGKSSGREYFERTVDLFEFVRESYERLAQAHEVLVIEGAGSAAEVNLRTRDIVNWRVAEMADASVLLVANIDPGGVFAQIVGTLELITPEERGRIGGIIINKFRGDRTLFADGVTFLEQRTGIPIMGVVPFLKELALDQEDSLDADCLELKDSPQMRVNVAVLLLPRMSNFTDFNALAAEPDVNLRYIRSPTDLIGADVIILPGSKNTIGDLEYVRRSGFVQSLEAHVTHGGELVGICGGYQMLGQVIRDPDEIESGGIVTGLGLLEGVTELTHSKMTRQIRAVFLDHGEATSLVVSGYYIHMGRTKRSAGYARFKLLHHSHTNSQMKAGVDIDTEQEDGAVNHGGSVWGTYIHGLFDEPEFRRYWLNKIRQQKDLPPLELSISTETTRRLAAGLDRWVDHVQKHIDWPSIAKMVGAPAF